MHRHAWETGRRVPDIELHCVLLAPVNVPASHSPQDTRHGVHGSTINDCTRHVKTPDYPTLPQFFHSAQPPTGTYMLRSRPSESRQRAKGSKTLVMASWQARPTKKCGCGCITLPTRHNMTASGLSVTLHQLHNASRLPHHHLSPHASGPSTLNRRPRGPTSAPLFPVQYIPRAQVQPA